jgi:hypothetical protein
MGLGVVPMNRAVVNLDRTIATNERPLISTGNSPAAAAARKKTFREVRRSSPIHIINKMCTVLYVEYVPGSTTYACY